MGGFIGHALVAEAELGVVRKEALLAGQHQPFAVLLSGVVNGAAEQLPGIAVLAVFRQGVDPKDHLPRAVLVVHGGILVHLIGQIGFVRHETVHEGDQLVPLVQEPEMVPVVPDPLDELLRSGSFCRWEALCLNGGQRCDILCSCGSNLHNVPPKLS